MLDAILAQSLGILFSAFPPAASDRSVDSPQPEIEVVSGHEVPVLREEPATDGVFLVRSSEPLAERHRRQLLSTTLDQFEREHLGALGQSAATGELHAPKGLPSYLVRVHRDDRGRLYLYRPCDASSRYIMRGYVLLMLGGEPRACTQPLAKRAHRRYRIGRKLLQVTNIHWQVEVGRRVVPQDLPPRRGWRGTALPVPPARSPGRDG